MIDCIRNYLRMVPPWMRGAILWLIFASTMDVHSQTIHPSILNDSVPRPTFRELQKSFYAAHAVPIPGKEEDEERDGEWVRFKRWEWLMETRVGSSGEIPRPGILLEELSRYNAARARMPAGRSIATARGKWRALGPRHLANNTGVNGGIGRVNCVRFDPLDTNTIFIGTPEGGLWKTTNKGNAWTSLTDQLPNLGVTDVAINPINHHIIYLASGDGDDAGMFGDPFSYGVMKSTDAGRTWSSTGLGFNIPDKMTIARLVVHPTNPNILLAGVTGNLGQNRGIWRSTDAGAQWTRVDGGAVYSIEFKPDNPGIVYASGYGNVRKSVDTGATWTTLTSPVLPTYAANGVSRTLLAVTPANPNVVYCIYVKGGRFFGLYRTTDAGATWMKQSDITVRNVIAYQGEYDLVLAVSPKNENLVFAGGPTMFMSTNGGATWSGTAFDIHVDQHALVFSPESGSSLYCGNDGGIYVTTDVSRNWNSISDGLQISQYYRMACVDSSPRVIYAGAQDNGFHKFDDVDGWTSAVSGADGTGCITDPLDTNSVYMEYQQGYLMHSPDGGTSVVLIAPDTNGNTGSWVTPIAIDPIDRHTLYAAYGKLYSSTNEGSTWSQISTALAGTDNMKSLAIAPSNNKVIYMGTYVNFFRTTNGGTVWTDIGAGTPISDTDALTSILVHPTNPRIVWATFSGFIDGQKIYKSTDAGATWTNISGTLPNVPVNCAIYQRGSNDIIYVGTDLGVYSRSAAATDWTPFNDSLPNVSVMHLQIQYTDRVLRAATFGRGIWESPLQGEALPAPPVLRLPPNGDTAVSISPTLQWNAVGGALSYHVQIDTSVAFMMPREFFNVQSTSLAIGSLRPGTQYGWRVAALNAMGEGGWSAVWKFTTGLRAEIEPATTMPTMLTLNQNHPNPFSAATTFRFTLARAAHATLTVTNLLGQLVAIPCDAKLESGTHDISWNTGTLPSGVYRYSIRANGALESRSMWIEK